MHDKNNLNNNCPNEPFPSNNKVSKNDTNDSETSYLESNPYNTFCENFTEQDDANDTKNETINPQFANRSDLLALLDKYENIFAKSKYDVGYIRKEPQRIHLISDLPVSI